ncbi:TonB-dependent receptor plug domain-containing protein [Sphingomonas faeni]
MPDILVIGKRTQNTDIERKENDVQPYKVWTSGDVAKAHSTSIDDFLRSKVTSNTQAGSALQSATGDTRSEVNLRGLGATQTLMLVDGRRLPSLPSTALANIGIEQSDINAIPLSAIERIEVLDSTAGGIYGPGATGGVVNIILKRDYRGVEINGTSGAANRGDASYTRIDGRLGFTPDHGATDVMLTASVAWLPQLRVGQRDFRSESRVRHQANDPQGLALYPPVSQSLNIATSGGGHLVLDPSYGGADLGSAITSVPTSYGGVLADGGRLLQANAGRYDTARPATAPGGASSLLSGARTTALSANVRHRLGTALEIYLDSLFLEGLGHAVSEPSATVVEIAADAPTNPFQQDIVVSYPLKEQTITRNRIRTTRFTGGVIADLPDGWKGNLDLAVGQASIRTAARMTTLSGYFPYYVYYGWAATPGLPANVLAGQQTFEDSTAALTLESNLSIRRTTKFSDLSLRLAGPLLTLPGGPMTLTILGEDRVERSAKTMAQLPTDGTDNPGNTAELPLPAFNVRTRSVYAELRAPLTDRYAGPAGLRGAELQFALRHDVVRSILPADTFTDALDNTVTQRIARAATLYTAGIKTSPFDGLLLRGSVATGFMPPAINQYASSSYLITHDKRFLPANPTTDAFLFLKTLPDAQRPGQILGGEGILTLSYGGSARLKPEHAQSISLGAVVTPLQVNDLRISVDYTRIRKTGEIVRVHSQDYAYFFQNEQRLTGRVVRAPLTEADRARGYTGGVVTGIDTTAFNLGETKVDAIDLQVDYHVPVRGLGGLKFQGAATWNPSLRRYGGPETTTTNYAGYSDGPLNWRANGGVEWSYGAQTLGFMATFYGDYRIAAAQDDAATADGLALIQGGPKIPSQLYFDLFASRTIRLPEGRRSLELRVGMQNVFNHSPPIIVAEYGNNYSAYGDPRLRRFELNVAMRF